MRPIVSLLTLALVALPCCHVRADLTVTTRDAQTVVTVTPETLTQIQTVDGDKIGQAVREFGPAVVRPASPAVVVGIKSDRDLAKSLVKIKCTTADVQMIETGVYVLSTPGTHVLDVNVISESPLQWDDELVTITVGESPAPDPDPTPEPTPDPTPQPGDAPIEGPGLRVLFVSESAEPMSPAIQAIFYSPEISAWLNANCIKVDGQPEFRRVDPDTQYTDPNHRFAKALKRPRATLPWLIISNGTSGYEGPFPQTVATTLELLKRFQSTSQASLSQPAVSVVVHTIPGCAPCHTFVTNELPKLSDVPISVVTGGADVYPTYTITAGSKSVSLTGRMSAEGLRYRIKEMAQ